MTNSGSHLTSQIIDHDSLFERLQAGHTLVTGTSGWPLRVRIKSEDTHKEK